MLFPMSSNEYRIKKIRAYQWYLLFWQAEHPLGGPREDVCETVAEYYEQEYIENLKVVTSDIVVKPTLQDLTCKLADKIVTTIEFIINLPHLFKRRV